MLGNKYVLFFIVNKVWAVCLAVTYDEIKKYEQKCKGADVGINGETNN